MPNPTTPQIEGMLEHREFVLDLARRLARDEDTAQELAQQTWVTAATRGASIRSMRGWLSRVIVNYARQSARASERRERRERAAARPERLPSTDEIAQRLEVERRVVAAVAALPERYRTVIFHRYFEGATVTQLASRLDLPEATVRTRLRRAIERLRESLDEDYAGDRSAWLAPLAFTGTGASFGSSGTTVSTTAAATASAEGAKVAQAAGTAKAAAAAIWIAAITVVGVMIVGTSRLLSDPPARQDRASLLTHNDEPPRDTVDRAEPAHGVATSPPPSAPPVLSTASSTVHGSVVDGLRRPVAGAMIEAWLAADDFRSGTPPLATTTTDADGRFTIVSEPFGSMRVAARAPGLVMRTAMVTTRVSAPVQTLGRFVLPDALATAGIVQSADGTPIGGALVLAVNENRMVETLGPCARTGADGRFELDGIALGESYLNIFAPGHDTRQVGPLSLDIGSLTIALQPRGQGAVDGIVYGIDGSTPVTGAQIWVTLHGDGRYPTNDYRLPYAISRTQTDATGHFSLPMLPPGRYDIRAYSDSLTIPSQDDIVVRADATTTIHFTATSAPVSNPQMSGVITTIGGNPFTSGSLRVARRTTYTGTLVAIGEDGTFDLESPVPEGESFFVWLEPETNGHALVGEDTRAGLQQVFAAVGETVELMATPAARLAGRVLTHDDQPIVGARVEIVGESWNERHATSASTTTAPDGSFTFDGLAPQARPIALRVEPSSHYLGRSTFFVAPDRYELTSNANLVDIEVRVSPRARISGKVVDDGGQPVAGAFLDARISNATPWHDATLTGRDGTFSMDRLPADTDITLHVSYTKVDGTGVRTEQALTLAAGEHRVNVVIELPTAQVPQDAIRGTVRFEDGSMPQHAWIAWTNGRGFGSRGGSPSFSLDNFPAEPFRMWAFVIPKFDVEDPPYAFLISGPKTVSPGNEIDWVIDRTQAGKATGRFAHGSPQPSRMTSSIRLIGESWSRSCPITLTEDGTFRLQGVTAGKYEIELRGDGILPKSIPVEIIAGVDLDLGEIAFESAELFRGKVTDPNGVPIEGALVKVGVASYGRVLDEKPVAVGSHTMTDSAGYFELEPRMGFDFSIWKEGYTQATFVRRAPSGELEHVILHPAGDLSISNLPAELSGYSSSASFWRFTIESSDPEKGRLLNRGQSDYGMQLDLYAIEAGDYTLHFWKTDEGSQSEPPPSPAPRAYLRFDFTIVAGQTTTVDFGAAW